MSGATLHHFELDDAQNFLSVITFHDGHREVFIVKLFLGAQYGKLAEGEAYSWRKVTPEQFTANFDDCLRLFFTPTCEKSTALYLAIKEFYYDAEWVTPDAFETTTLSGAFGSTKLLFHNLPVAVSRLANLEEGVYHETQTHKQYSTWVSSGFPSIKSEHGPVYLKGGPA